MSKLKLNPAPTFTAKVPIPVPGSAPVPVEFTFKYRTAAELREFSSSARKATDEKPDEAAEIEAFKSFVVGWELDDAFTDENIARLLDAYPGAPRSLTEVYLTESYGVRLGN